MAAGLRRIWRMGNNVLSPPDMTWKCHVCGDERPDDKISVHKVKDMFGIPGMMVPVEANVRHCNDRSKCCDGAESIGHMWLHSGGADA